MPVVNTNIIKEWFSNLKKPPQEQFWAWLDSFRHKWEKIPLIDIEGLIGILQKKADLVDGVVPEDQLPFSVVTSEVLAMGAVSVNSKINLAVHSSGANKVRVKGRTIIRSFPNQWDFTPFVGSGIKVIRGYAVKSEDDFFISEGDELPTYTEPQIPENALEIFKITISINGIVIDEASQYGSKMKADDQWTNAYLGVEEGDYLSVQNQPSSFNLVIDPSIISPKLFGVMTVRVFTNDNNFAWDGKEFLMYTERDVLLTTQEGDPVAALPFAEGTNYTAKAGTYTRLKIRDNKVLVIPGGGANFPEVGNDGDVLERDSTLPAKVKWSNTKLSKPIAPNNIAERVINADGSTSPKGDFLRGSQIEIGSNTPAQEAWKGKLILITASCTITIPATLSNEWGCEIATLTGVTLTMAITTPKTWLFGTPTTIPEKSIFTLAQRGGTNSIAIFGL